MYQTLRRHYQPPPPPEPVAPQPPQQPDPEPGSAESTAFDGAATLAGRTPVNSETLGADGKAAAVLTLLGIMFTVLARFGPELGTCLHGNSVSVKIVCLALLVGFGSMALCTVVQAFRTISPRFPNVKPSLAFFGEISRMSREEYTRRVEAMDMQQAVEEILLYNHTAATICARKFHQLRFALRYFEIAAGCWLALWAILVMRSLIA